MSQTGHSPGGPAVIVESESQLAARLAQRVAAEAVIVSSFQELQRQRLDDPGLALIAHWLPDAKGIEALEYVRAVQPETVCLVTAPAIDDQLRAEALMHGASDVIPTSDAAVEMLPWIVETATLRAQMHADRDRAARRVANSLSHMQRLYGDLQQEIGALERLASTDELTGLHNRRWLRSSMKRAWEGGLVAERNLGLIMLDMDGFKLFNDTYGHPAGDQLLRAVGAALRDSCRQTDVPARLGGDEFAVLLPRTPWVESAAITARLLDRLRQCIAQHARGCSVSVSVGLAHMDLSMPAGMDSFIKHADEALYAAKRSGKNCMMIRGETGIFTPAECARQQC